MEQTKPSQSLPDNAYRELKPGEEYVPMMPADAKPKEVTPYSVTMGLLMAVLFSAAAAYLGLRIGQVFEAAIPIAIIAVGVGNMLGKKNMLGQNVIIQSIGASSGIIVAGAIFTLPALYILGLETAFYKVFLSSVLGGILGIVLLIISYVVLYKTRFGLRLRACGEHPQAADSVGINVYKMRYAGVLISGALGAIGGMAYIVPPVQTWNFEVGVAGAGFLAMAVMIFGQWKPFNICAAAMFFAVFKSLANIADSTFLAQFHWSSNIYNMMPFIASMIILAFTSKNSMAPKAEGIPYDKGSR